MKRLALFLVLLASVDLVGGAALQRLYRRTLTGEAGGLFNYQLTKEAEVLALGSSRARHHFVPPVLREKLSMTVFNAGLDGHEFLYTAVLVDLWRRVHAPPRVVLLHVDAHSLLRDQRELQRAVLFAPYVDESERAREILLARGPYEPVKLVSRLYRFNGKVLPMLKNLFLRPDPGFDGFVPLAGTLDPKTAELTPHDEAMHMAQEPYWELKVRYFEDLVAWCRASGTRLFLVHGPAYLEDRAAYDVWMRRLERFVARYPDVELVDISEATHPELAGRADLYDDAHHLNARGAAVFSTLLGDAVREGLARGAAPRRVTARASPPRAEVEVAPVSLGATSGRAYEPRR
jgi:hypothetical protein